MNRNREVLRFAAVLALLGGAGTARADGMGFVDKTAAGTTGGEVGKAVPTVQRAALVREGTAWSLVLEPKYDRPKAGVAWLVPFAHCPTVAAADPTVLAELGLVTAPLFLQVCLQSCRCGDHSPSCLPAPFGGGKSSSGDFGGDGDGSTSAGTNGQQALDVDVWQSGTIGDLDFAVISAGDPADIPKWLDQGGYDNPPELADFVTGHAADYGCYFAAKLGVPADEHDVFPAVRFDLDPRDPPSYPLQLTKLGVAEGQTLGVTLFVVNPADRIGDATTNVAPEGFEAFEPTCAATTAAEFQACVDRDLAAQPSKLAVTFHDSLASRKAVFQGSRRLCNAYDYYSWRSEDHWCVGTADVFTGLPATWTPEVQGWLDAEARITRYEARLPPSALDRDLVFRAGPGAPAQECVYDEDCYELAKWDWEGTTCASSGDGMRCRTSCRNTADCPRGWGCQTFADSVMACAPPAGAAGAEGLVVTDELPLIDGLNIAYTSGCGYDCDEVCYGSAAPVAPDPGPPGLPRAFVGTVPPLALLLALQLVLVAWLRRRDARAYAS